MNVLLDLSYAYDMNGNRTSMTDNKTGEVTNYTYNPLNQMLTAGDKTFTYDATCSAPLILDSGDNE